MKMATAGARPASQSRLKRLEAEVGNLVDAIAAGGLRGSSRLAERLRSAEAELATLKAPAT
jgi:hypothetical protein